MIEKVCMVTGATAGLGFVTARALARLGATVILVGRDQAKAEAAAAQVRKESGSSTIEWMAADLASQAEVRQLAAELRGSHRVLHVLVNNAGAIFSKRRLSPDGLEMTLAVNHLAPFLLTRLGWSLIHLRYHRLVVGAEHPWVSVGPDEGARTIIHVASSPEVEGVSGQYFSGCRPMPSSPESRDPEAARRLWAVSERLTAIPAG